MPIVRFPAMMKYYVENQSEFSMDAASVAELIQNLVSRYPTLQPHLVDSSGALRRHFHIFVNGTELRELHGIETPLHATDKVILMASAAGGVR